MIGPRNLVLAVVFVMLTATFAAASDIYVAQSAAGGNTGADCADAHSAAWFNSSQNWGSGNGQIGPGTTVHLCGTFDVPAGAAGLTVLGSGSAGSGFITLLAEPNAIIQSPHLGAANLFTGNCSPSSSCLAGIQVYQQNHIILDGGTNGIIQNTANGTNLANQQCSLGIFIHGDHVIVRNWTVQNIYLNAGSSPGASDSGGSCTANIRADSSTNLAIYNNVMTSARIGIDVDGHDTTGPNNCPTPIGVVGVTTPASVPAPTGNWGTCIYNNTLSDHAWQGVTTGTNITVNIFSNEWGDQGTLPGWLNWQYPTSSYHQNGWFFFDDGVPNSVVTAYVYNNYSHGDLGQGSPTGHISFNSSGSNGGGSGGVVFNNIVVQTASSNNPNDDSHDQLIDTELDGAHGQEGPLTEYNNTLIGGAYCHEWYTSSSHTIDFIVSNNICMPGRVSSATAWYYNATDGGTYISSWTGDGNLYYNGNAHPWQYQGSSYSSLAAWQAICDCDANAAVGSPLLNTDYSLQASSPARGLGTNLTSLGIAALNADIHAVPRPASGAWDAGAYQYSTTDPPPAPPTGLNAVVQ